MATFFRKPDRRQRFLLPVDMQDWLPESDFVHLVLDAVEQMDLSGFEAEYRTGGAGQAPFAPAMIVAVHSCETPRCGFMPRRGAAQAAPL